MSSRSNIFKTPIEEVPPTVLEGGTSGDRAFYHLHKALYYLREVEPEGKAIQYLMLSMRYLISTNVETNLFDETGNIRRSVLRSTK